MKRNNFDNKPINIGNEFNIDIEDDYDYYQTENINDENIDLGHSIVNELQPRESYLYSNQCEKENCINVANEIGKLCDECLNLEHKCILIDHIQSKSLLESTERVSELNKTIINMIDVVDNHEGEGLDECSYPKLTKLEMNLLKLLTKVKTRISTLEYDIVTGKKEDYRDDLVCAVCRKINVNCVVRPCNHLCLCCDCVKNILKCPMCNKFIEYFDKVFLPNN
jgi:hypothetical protein